MSEVGTDKKCGFATIGNAHAFFQNPIGGQCCNLLKQTLVVDIRHVNSEATRLGEFEDAVLCMSDVRRDFRFDGVLGSGVEFAHVHPGEIHASLVFIVVFQIAEEIDLLKGSSQTAGIG